MSGPITGAALLLASFAAQPAFTKDSSPGAYHVVARLDARVHSVGWRLARANAPFCETVVPAVGLLVQDIQSWDDPDGARAAFGVDPATQVVVGAVAEGSPAQTAGLRAGQPLRNIVDTVLDSDLPPARPGSYERQAGLLDLIDRSLQDHGWVAVGIDGEGGKGGQLMRVMAQDTCASRFEIVTENGKAVADGKRVLISADLALELADEDQFAFVVAHELAHNILGHVAMLDAKGRKWGRVRHTEREADRLAVWLMANAGYDTGGAQRFMLGWARNHDVGFLDPTHDAWDERLAGVDAEIALVAASPAQVGGYDWSQRFPLGAKDAKSAR
ncbi:hypothetical protein EKN06_06775 [Croceicoccus ponticola]|uniref:Peptidase M48 domain-containing protein n=2 Tax=Croceicoccus ponticola TaxID=2217664 RepID=A0A437GY84_9SPHN|nr:hypothetical protein EKN06_06775 [Croceicoccus ponticola]